MAKNRTTPWHKRYHREFLQSCRGLPLELIGAYSIILDLIYDEAGPIHFDERWLAAWFNCSTRKVRAVISELLTAQKLYLTADGRIGNRRADREIQEMFCYSRKQSDRASKRNENAGRAQRKSLGLDMENEAKPTRKQIESVLKLPSENCESSDFDNKNNENDEPRLSHGSAIIDKDKDIITTVVEDTSGLRRSKKVTTTVALDDDGNVITATPPSKLLMGLTRQTEGARALQGVLEQQRRSIGNRAW